MRIHRATRTLLPADERKASILRAAAAAFARTGYRDTSLEDVAAEAGITRVIVYRHFGSKADLYRAVLTEVCERLIVRFDEESRKGDAGFGLRILLEVGREHPDAFALLWRHAVHEPEFAEYARGFRAGATQATESTSALQVVDVLQGWWSEAALDVLVALVLDWLEDGDPERDAEWLAVVSPSVLAMVGAWAPRRR